MPKITISDEYKKDLQGLHSEVMSLDVILTSATEKNQLINKILTTIADKNGISRRQVLIDYAVNIRGLKPDDAEKYANSRLVQITKSKPANKKNKNKVNSRKGKEGKKKVLTSEDLITKGLEIFEKMTFDTKIIFSEKINLMMHNEQKNKESAISASKRKVA